MLRLLLGLVGLSAVVSTALAGPQSYSQRVQSIRAGIVVLSSAKATLTGAPQSAAPYALYNLDSNKNLKPAGWSISNPYAPSRVTDEIHNRWISLDSSTPATGTPISKANAPYWEVFLSQVSDDTLANYDLLLVNPRFYASLNPTERERLRRFVDHGGVLWIDPAGLNPGIGGMDEINGFPIPFLQSSLGGSFPTTDFNSLLTKSTFNLNSSDIANLDTLVDGGFTPYSLQNIDLSLYGAGAAGMSTLAGGMVTDFFKLQTISALGGNPVLSLGRIGDGFVVVTARGASLMLNRSHDAGMSYLANLGFYAMNPVLDADGQSAAKLAVNMISLLKEYRQPGGGSQKTSSTAIDLNPPLLARSAVADAHYGDNNGAASPTLYKGLLVTTANGIVHVYDANPASDLDGDGNPDDGIQDYSLGTSYDEVWRSAALTPPLSSPVCCEVPGASGGPTDAVLVVDGGGNLHVFNLMPRNSDGTLSGTANEAAYSPIAPPNGSAFYDSQSPIPLAPTVHEGVAYVTDNVQRNLGQVDGRIWLVDLANGGYISSSGSGGPFVVGGNNSSVTLPEFTYSSTVGYIPILDNSGGVDKVAYTPFAGNPSAGITSAGFTSLWLGVRGERPTTYDPQPGSTATALQVTTRASQRSLPIFTGSGSLGVKLTILDQYGNPLTASGMSQLFTGAVQDLGGGILSFPFKSGVTALPSGTTGVRLDYNIDWGSSIPGVLASVERGRLMLPDQAATGTTSPRSIQGGVALSPRGTAYVVASQPGTNGGLFGFREQGRGVFNCVNRYELYPSHNITLNENGVAASLPTVIDEDYLVTNLVPFLNNKKMTGLSFVGGPSIRNGQVLVSASGHKGFIPVTIVMAFNAEPQTAQINIGELPDGTTFLQPDIARSSVNNAPEIQTALSTGAYTYDPNTQVVQFPSLSGTNTGPIQNCLSLSQPLIVRKPGQPDYLIQPDSIGGSTWSPLQWFYVIDGMVPSGSAPLITGNSVFVSGNSSLYNGLTSNNWLQTNGVVFALNAQIPSAQLHATLERPWQNQLWSINPDGAGGFKGDPNIVWPQFNSVTSMSDLEIKVGQAVLGIGATSINGSGPVPSTKAFGVVGGDSVLAAWGDQGLYTFAKGNLTICDEGRVIELDASGNPIWSTDTTFSPGQSNLSATGNSQSLVRPVRAYKVNDSRYLVVDAGANRVASIGKDGVEGRSITGFRLDPNIVPSGFVAGESQNLNGPRDAVYYTNFISMNNVGALVTIGDGENANNTECWQHYLIADTGNKRLIEVVDRFYYDPATQTIGAPVTVNGIAQIGVLVWHSPAIVSGKDYAYSSLSRLKVPDGGAGHYVYVAGIGGTLPTRVGNGLDPQSPTSVVDVKAGNGGIVVFDPVNPNGLQVFNSIDLPDVSGTNFWNPTTGIFDNTIDQSTAKGVQTYIRRKGGKHYFSNLNSVTAKLVQVGGTPQLAIMVADGSGVYEAIYDPTVGGGLSLDWMMPNEVFRAMKQTIVGGVVVPSGSNATDLRALFARRLDSGEILIVNGYTGTTFGGATFNGEIMQVDGTANSSRWSLTNLGFGNTSISLNLSGKSPATGTRGILMPVFADRR